MQSVKQVTIEVDGAGVGISSPMPRGGTVVAKLVSCRPYGANGMIELIEIISNGPVSTVIDAIRSDPNTEYMNCHVFDKHRASCILVTKDSPVCRALASTESFCKTCALEVERPLGARARWEVIFSGKTSLKAFLSRVKSKGVPATIEEVGEPKKSRLLTFEQEEVIRRAEEGGYFEFPRRMSLRELSDALSISTSTLDEVLRRAESKIIGNHVVKPNGVGNHKHDKIR
jgi:predicted DNA binding protein